MDGAVASIGVRHGSAPGQVLRRVQQTSQFYPSLHEAVQAIAVGHGQERLPDLESAMFDRWLALFGESCAEVLEPEAADAFRERAGQSEWSCQPARLLCRHGCGQAAARQCPSLADPPLADPPLAK